MATIQTIRGVLRLCRQANVTCNIWGHRGLGKSSIVYQEAQAGCGETMKLNGETYDLPMGFIDLRCSQMEASDLRGLPDKQDGRTVFFPPADLPRGDMTAEEIEKHLMKIEDPEARRQERQRMQPRYQNGILFLDELCRAQDDVLQAAFQLVLDRKVGQYVLPAGWSVVSANNFLEGDYQTNGFTDAAFLNRFCHVTLSQGDQTLPDWVQYMGSLNSEAATNVIAFCTSNLKNLDGEVSGELGFTIKPSRRSWEMVTRIMDSRRKMPDVPEISVTEAISGLVGRETAISFMKYSCPVKPQDIIADGVKKHLKTLESLNRGQMIGLAWGVVSHVGEKAKTDEKVAETCLDLVETLLSHPNIGDKDIPVAFCHNLLNASLTNDTQKVLRAAVTSPQVAKLIGQLLGKSKSVHYFVQGLDRRPALQNLLTKIGWGKSGVAV